MSTQVNQRPILIAHIVYSLGTGGLENGLVNLINRSDTTRFRHMVICLTTAGRFADRILVDDVAIIELNKPAGHSIRTFLHLRKVIVQHRPDIIHSRNLAALEVQIATLGIKGLKRVHGEHGRDFNDPEGKNWKYNALRRISRLWIDQYVAVSGELKRWLQDSIGVPAGKILQQPNGVDCEVFSPVGSVPKDLPNFHAEENVAVVGTVGRLVPIKDQKTLITAFTIAQQYFAARGKQLALIIVGDGPLMPPLKEQVREISKPQMVWFTGDRADVNQLIRAMDIFVLASIAEGVSNTLLEAMATGTAVMSTSVGGAPDIVEDDVDGCFFEVGDSEGLSKELIRLISDRDVATEMGRKAREKVERDFSWPATISRYEAMYWQLSARSDVSSRREQVHAH